MNVLSKYSMVVLIAAAIAIQVGCGGAVPIVLAAAEFIGPVVGDWTDEADPLQTYHFVLDPNVDPIFDTSGTLSGEDPDSKSFVGSFTERNLTLMPDPANSTNTIATNIGAVFVDVETLQLDTGVILKRDFKPDFLTGVWENINNLDHTLVFTIHDIDFNIDPDGTAGTFAGCETLNTSQAPLTGTYNTKTISVLDIQHSAGSAMFQGEFTGVSTIVLTAPGSEPITFQRRNRAGQCA